jgi:SAM-dependent methyltransferase
VDAAYVAAHIESSPGHWWYRGRLAVLLSCLRRTLPARPLRLLELGCGTGEVLAALRQFGEAVGMEPHPDFAAAARKRGLDVRDGRLPNDLGVPDHWADVVLLLDVLEHVNDDLAALTAASRALAVGGTLVVTVPAFPWLWSPHDVALGHRRRYTARTLRAVATRAGFGVERMTYFNTLLFPAIVAARLWKRGRATRGHDLEESPPLLNGCLERVFALERHLAPRLVLPFGSSLLMLARQ